MVTRIDNDIAETHNVDGYGTVDMWRIFQYLALDIIGETAFGETFNMLEKSDHPVPRTITKNMETGSYVSTLIEIPYYHNRSTIDIGFCIIADEPSYPRCIAFHVFIWQHQCCSC